MLNRPVQPVQLQAASHAEDGHNIAGFDGVPAESKPCLVVDSAGTSSTPAMQ